MFGWRSSCSSGRSARRSSAARRRRRRQAVAFLEATDRFFGFGSEDAVDFDAPERRLQQLAPGGLRCRSMSTIECSVVVAGSGLGAEEAGPCCRWRCPRRGPDGERGERADRDALGARAARHELQLGGAPAGARAAEGELPRLLVGEVAQSLLPASSGEGAAGAAGRRSNPRPARARRARERSSEALQWSATARSRGDPDMRGRPFSISFPCAYGVSCRARVNDYATPHLWRFAPAASRLQWVPRSWAPWGAGLGTTRGNLTETAAKCVTAEGARRFLPTARARGRGGGAGRTGGAARASGAAANFAGRCACSEFDFARAPAEGRRVTPTTRVGGGAGVRGSGRGARRVRLGRARGSPSGGRSAPALPTQTLQGAPVTLSGLLAGDGGRPALVVFWASWCGPCSQEAPALERFSQSAPGRGADRGRGLERRPRRARGRSSGAIAGRSPTCATAKDRWATPTASRGCRRRSW